MSAVLPDPSSNWSSGSASAFPSLVMATGCCEDQALVILGVSLANGSFVSCLACLVALAAAI
ncbi:disulfide bond formation protein B [Thiocapsa imhoffii]|uniref:disulfide bond formation protein B n=1 Tax=Thiocapsa imhoffii TaxID=382777 RepID=UPI00190465F9|nr:disulfide bond formation protein B [Thiocapsa imhoffii]